MHFSAQMLPSWRGFSEYSIKQYSVSTKTLYPLCLLYFPSEHFSPPNQLHIFFAIYLYPLKFEFHESRDYVFLIQIYLVSKTLTDALEIDNEYINLINIYE